MNIFNVDILLCGNIIGSVQLPAVSEQAAKTKVQNQLKYKIKRYNNGTNPRRKSLNL